MNAPTSPQNLAALCERWARETPDAPVVLDGAGRSLSYQQLDELGNRLAARLVEAGVGRSDRVGICLPKSINSIVSIVGVLKSGAAYVPMDFSAPPDRNRFIVGNCRMKAVCLDEPRSEALGLDESQVALLVFPGEATDGVGAEWLEDQPTEGPGSEPAASDDLAYILYTSGSTGVPKGVVHTHASALSFIGWAAETFQPTSADRFSSHAPFHFDLSILDLYVPMMVGAAVVLVSEDVGKDPRHLAPFIAENKITIWYSVPSVLSVLAEHGDLPSHDCSALRLVLFAGEVFPVKHLRALKRLWPEKACYNLYGPTETNVCTFYRIPDQLDEAREAPYPIGAHCGNVESLVLDENDRAVSDAKEGQLHILASGPVMKEYWELPDLTASAFFVDEAGGRWYRTGDVVTLDGDGNYTFLGRRDRMVKRHGYRVELGEIEAAMYQHPEVREAAAVAAESEDGVQIRAYLCTKDKAPISIIALRQFCAANLPSYMNPDLFLFVDQLPRTSTDKVDYQTLLAGQ